MLVCSLPYATPPLPEATLDFHGYTLTALDIDRMTSVVPQIEKQRVADLIEGRAKFDLPVVVMREGQPFIYRHVETVVARHLLGDDQVIARVIYG